MISTKISVIIPMYNARQYIAECLDSVLAQDFQPHEIIVVDDGSTDGGVLVSGYQNVTLITKPNGGVTSARRAGVSAASGEWIYFLDADDTINRKELLSLVSRIFGDTCLVIGNSKVDGSIDKDEYVSSILSTGLFPTGPVSKLYKKSVFSSLDKVFDLPRDIVRGEDLLMLLRITDNIHGAVELVKTNHYNYRMHEGQVTNTFYTTADYEYRFYNELLRSFASDKEIDKNVQGLIKNRLSAIELILLGQRYTKDYKFKASAWFENLKDDIKTYGYRLSIWEWLLLHFVGSRTIRPLRVLREFINKV